MSSMIVETASSVLLFIAVRATVVFAGAFLIVALLGCRRSASRVSCWRWASLALLVMPLLALSATLLPEAAATRIPIEWTDVDAAREQVTNVISVSSPVTMAKSAQLPRLLHTPSPVGTAWAFVIVWLAGVCVLSLRSWLSWRAVRAAARCARVPDPRVAELMAQLAAGRGLHARLPLTLMSERATSPMVFGIRHPVILLPDDCVNWTDSRLRVVLMHELAHIDRGDISLLAAMQVIRAVCWLNPLAWMAFHRARYDQECAADAHVLQARVDPVQYAETLLSFAEGYAPRILVAAGIRARRSKLNRRLRRILAADAMVTPRSAGRVAAVVALAACTLGAASIRGDRPDRSAALAASMGTTQAAMVHDPVIHSLLFGSPEERRAAVEKARAKDPSFVLERVTPLLASSCYGNRYRAARAFRDLRAPAAVPLLVDRLLEDDHPAVRAMAMNAIATSDAAAGARLLRSRLVGATPAMFLRVERALETIDGSPVQSRLAHAIASARNEYTTIPSF